MDIFKKAGLHNVEDMLTEMFEQTKQNMYEKYGMELDDEEDLFTNEEIKELERKYGKLEN